MRSGLEVLPLLQFAYLESLAVDLVRGCIYHAYTMWPLILYEVVGGRTQAAAVGQRLLSLIFDISERARIRASSFLQSS